MASIIYDICLHLGEKGLYRGEFFDLFAGNGNRSKKAHRDIMSWFYNEKLKAIKIRE